MLTDFFRLNAPTHGSIKVFHRQEELTDFLINAKGVVDALFQPGTLTLPDPETRRSQFPRTLFTAKAFTNVSFSWTTISGVTFRDCAFTDCLFMSTRFVDCEFHDCTFKGCNPHKVVFENTYIDPLVFEGMLDQVDIFEYRHAPVPATVQELNGNASTRICRCCRIQSTKVGPLRLGL